MFGVAYFKSEPTDYLLIFHGKKLARKGAGLAFYYWRASTSIVLTRRARPTHPSFSKRPAAISRR